MSLRLPPAAALLAATLLAACASSGARVDMPGATTTDSAALANAPARPKPTPFFEFQVESPARELGSSCAPAYPEELRAAPTRGEVVAQFIVDQTGVPDTATFKVVRATHQAFGVAVRAALSCMRYTPARIGGGSVRQLVQRPFVFDVPR
jgi:TonB family protein